MPPLLRPLTLCIGQNLIHLPEVREVSTQVKHYGMVCKFKTTMKQTRQTLSESTRNDAKLDVNITMVSYAKIAEYIQILQILNEFYVFKVQTIFASQE